MLSAPFPGGNGFVVAPKAAASFAGFGLGLGVLFRFRGITWIMPCQSHLDQLKTDINFLSATGDSDEASPTVAFWVNCQLPPVSQCNQRGLCNIPPWLIHFRGINSPQAHDARIL